MLNMKKVFLTGAILTALGATAFAADIDDKEPQPSMRARVNAILHEDCPFADCDGTGRHSPRHLRRPLTNEERQYREQLRAEWETMTPEQRQEARAKLIDARTKNMTAEEKAAFEERLQQREQRFAERRQYAEAVMNKLSDEQKAEVEAFIKQDLEQRRQRHEKLMQMTPEQREAVHAQLRAHDHDWHRYREMNKFYGYRQHHKFFR